MYKNFIIPYLYEAQYVSGDKPPIIRSLKLHWQPLLFHTWKVVGHVVGGRCQAVPYNWGILFQSFNQTRRKNSGEKTRFAKEKIIFHQDNAPTHKSVLAMGKLRDLHYKLLEHPPYSPDLAPSDFCLFRKLKLFLAGQPFFFESRGDCSCRGVFCRSYEEPLQGRENGAGASLE
jgi:hypothetical protein